MILDNCHDLFRYLLWHWILMIWGIDLGSKINKCSIFRAESFEFGLTSWNRPFLNIVSFYLFARLSAHFWRPSAPFRQFWTRLINLGRFWMHFGSFWFNFKALGSMLALWTRFFDALKPTLRPITPQNNFYSVSGVLASGVPDLWCPCFDPFRY